MISTTTHNNADKEMVNSKKNIIIKGAKVHNLKDIDVIIPKNKLIVITGVSGSGKSSLAFDTLYAEGQRRYVESLSSYARQFLGKMNKPEVEYIKGLSPAIAIEQRVNSRNPRSTVGTSTEIYEYIKLLFSRIGKTFSPISGDVVKRDTVTDVINYILKLKKSSKVAIYSPLTLKENRSITETLNILLQQGFTRVNYKSQILRIEDITSNNSIHKVSDVLLLIDRFSTEDNVHDDFTSRLSDSVQTCFYEGNGICIVESFEENEKPHRKEFSNNFNLDGLSFEEPTENFFSFNNPYGACKRCEGFGNVMGIDEDLVMPDKSLSIYENAAACWRGEKLSEWKEQLVINAYKFDFPIHKPVRDLSKEEIELLWAGNVYFKGLNDFFIFVEEQQYKIQYRVLLSRYRGKTVCPDCKGTRLRKDANYVKICGLSVTDIVFTPIDKLYHFFCTIKLNDYERNVSERLIIEIKNRLEFLNDVGLGYLTLNRLSSSLSGGESQRINLATSLGSSLVGSMYILDEPSIGLHSRDTDKLIKILLKLRDLGNTVIVVEHDEKIILSSDIIIDIGPLAGEHGGNVVFNGSYDELIKSSDSLTSDYITGKKNIPLPTFRRKWNNFIKVNGARENNLKSISVKFPLNVLSVITGVSGSGKSSLVRKILFSALKKHYGGVSEKSGKFDKLEGDLRNISDVEFVDQNPIGRSTRSNPATYVKAFDDIRNLFSTQQLSKIRGYKPGYFSFNIPGGRCEECEGEGIVKIEMQFMADVSLLCESCHGKRFKDEVLDIKYRGLNISDILNLTINQALTFFSNEGKANTDEKRIVEKLSPLEDVGLGYLRMGQTSSTLSGGEAQRIKLASFLSKGQNDKPMLFMFDEPTTGLHFHDINKLLKAFNSLIEKGHSIIVIEHNPDIIKCADWVIDLGPEGGENGGNIVFEGTPEELILCKDSYTAQYVIEKIMLPR